MSNQCEYLANQKQSACRWRAKTIKMRNPIAHDFKNIAAPTGFVNLNEITDLSSANWLHPVESLYGNWQGDFMILGQDYNGFDNIKDYSVTDFQHDPNFPTNKTILEVFGTNFEGLYANFFWFVKAGKANSPLSTRREVVEANMLILEKTINSMPNLKIIFTLGQKAIESAFALPYQPLKAFNTVKFNRNLLIVCLPHLGALGISQFRGNTGTDRDQALEKIKSAVSDFINDDGPD